jgi:hypothetical protein
VRLAALALDVRRSGGRNAGAQRDRPVLLVASVVAVGVGARRRGRRTRGERRSASAQYHALMTTKVFLTFPQKLIKEPILYDLVKRFPVKTNIRGASVTDVIALVALQIDGKEADIEAAIAHLAGLGVQVERLAD